MKKLLIVLLCFNFFWCCAQQNSNLKIASDYFDFLFRKGDFESINKILDLNAIYTQAKGLPYGGTYVGFGEWKKMFSKVQEYLSLEVIDNPVFFVNESGDKVIVNFNVKFISRQNQEEITMAISEIIELENSKIIRVTPYYFDTKSLVDLLNLPKI